MGTSLPALADNFSDAVNIDEADDEHALSVREQEVADWVAEGKKNKEIAEILGISEQTVKNHLHSIFSKWRMDSREELARRILVEQMQDGNLTLSRELNQGEIQTGLKKLNSREKMVIHHIGEGLYDDLIAKDLKISLTYLDEHIKHVMTTLGLENERELIYVAHALRDQVQKPSKKLIGTSSPQISTPAN